MEMLNPIFLADAYKVSHFKLETAGTQFIQANFTPRSFRLSPIKLEGAVVYGTQRMVKRLKKIWDKKFFKRPKKDVIEEAYRIFKPYLGMAREDLKHFEALHDLGYLPLEIRGIREGSIVQEKTPILVIENTHEDFAWLVTYLETWISTEIWSLMTTATTAYHFRKLCNEFAMRTVGSTVGTEFQIHDFSYRGQGPDEAAGNGGGFLLSSFGTDTIPAILDLEEYYNADVENELVAASVPASEHSVTCVGIAINGELETIRDWIINKYPTGIVSVVADTLDYWKTITEYASALKEDILNRQVNELGLAKVVFRPDSGDPVKILTGLRLKDIQKTEYTGTDSDLIEAGYDGVISYGVPYEFVNGRRVKVESEAVVKGSVECLWDIFGGTISDEGYKVLHERVGLIYGDSITYDRAQRILERLEEKGFASTNCVFGVGSYTVRYVTRDTLGSAVKVTYAQVNDEHYAVYKDPKTDSGVKKSARGYLDVIYTADGGFELVEFDKPDYHPDSALTYFFKDGAILRDETLEGIRERLWS